jgi:tetratricopeptide (TPR) repeat protein
MDPAMKSKYALVLLGALFMSASPSARAGDAAVAEALFAEARQLMAQGRYAEACPKLESSNRIDPATGTLLNLASCYEKLGRTATAWALYLQVAGSPQGALRADYARQHADALLPTLPKLTIRAPTAPPDAHVTRDGIVVPVGAFGAPIPVDPGHHVIEATASGRISFHREIDIATGATTSVVVTLPAT